MVVNLYPGVIRLSPHKLFSSPVKSPRDTTVRATKKVVLCCSGVTPSLGRAASTTETEPGVLVWTGPSWRVGHSASCYQSRRGSARATSSRGVSGVVRPHKECESASLCWVFSVLGEVSFYESVSSLPPGLVGVSGDGSSPNLIRGARFSVFGHEPPRGPGDFGDASLFRLG